MECGEQKCKCLAGPRLEADFSLSPSFCAHVCPGRQPRNPVKQGLAKVMARQARFSQAPGQRYIYIRFHPTRGAQGASQRLSMHARKLRCQCLFSFSPHGPMTHPPGPRKEDDPRKSSESPLNLFVGFVSPFKEQPESFASPWSRRLCRRLVLGKPRP